MYFRQIYIFILAVSLLSTGCQSLATDPGDTYIPVLAVSGGVISWGDDYNDFGYGVFETADGGYAVVGSQYSTETQEDLILVKFGSDLDSANTKQTTYIGTGSDTLSFNDNANDIQQTADGGYVLVGNTFNGTDYDVLVVKFTPELVSSWQDTIDGGGSDDVGNSIRQRQDGGFVVCGNSYDGDDEDIMLWGITVAADGTPAHSVLYNSEPTVATDNGTRDFGNHAEQTYDGGYIIVGTSVSGIKLIKLKSDKTLDTAFGVATDGLATLGVAGDEGTFVQQTSNGSYIVAGNTQGGAGSQSEVTLHTVSSAGIGVLTRTMGGSFNDEATALIQTDDGGFVFTGKQYNETTGDDVWVVKLNPTLNTQWNRKYGGSLNDNGSSIKETDDGGYIITGSSMSYGQQSQIILIEIEFDGCVWESQTLKTTCGL